MKLYIPEIGDILELSSDWEFTLYFEHRNGIWEALDEKYKLNARREHELAQKRKEHEESDLSYGFYYWNHTIGFPVVIPATTQLKIDRIYIRKGNEEYSSVTFNIMSCPLPELTLAKDGGTFPKYGKRRFWAKLADVNRIEFIKCPSI